MTHEKPTECEGCDKPASVKYVFKQWLCHDCEVLETEAYEKAKMQREKYQTPISVNPVNTTVQVRTDLFNAVTQSIQELKTQIDSDSSIENKQYALAEKLQAQINEFKKVIFDLDEKKIEVNNKQRATQEYLNNLANQLRSEEREKLRLQDISYKPKAIAKPIKTTVKKAKIDKTELRNAAKELGVQEFTLQSLIVAKGFTVEQAVNHLRRVINESKSESSN